MKAVRDHVDGEHLLERSSPIRRSSKRQSIIIGRTLANENDWFEQEQHNSNR